MKVGDNLFDGKNWDFENIDQSKFEEHIAKSVPGYSEGHQYITFLSDYFINSKSIIYDIGCSTGNLIKKLSLQHISKKELNFVGIEPAALFKDYFLDNLSSLNDLDHSHTFEFKEENVQNFAFQACDLIISYYTMQFIRPKYRQKIFNNIYDSLNWGGGFFLFEKVRGNDARFHEMINLSYLQYKASRGYTSEEILSKMILLKGNLEPYTSNENYKFLERAGFKDYTTILKNLCFEGILAIK